MGLNPHRRLRMRHDMLRSVDTPVLDTAMLEELREIPGLLEDVLAVFARASAENIGAIHSALSRNDHAEARRHAHALKGASAQVGAARLSAEAAMIETCVRAGNTPGENRLDELLVESLAALASYRGL